MKRGVLVFGVLLAVGAAVVTAGCGRTKTVTRTVTVSGTGTSGAPRQSVLYGHIEALAKNGGRFEMRFDPAYWLTGFAAQRAKLEDTGSSDVPNDYYIVEEGHRLLSYIVSPTARVTVLTGGVRGTPITVSELAQIVSGKNPKHRPLSEPKAGFWIRVGDKFPNPVLSLDQQYQP